MMFCSANRKLRWFCHASAHFICFTAVLPAHQGNIDHCSGYLSERCDKIECSLEIYTLGNFQNGIYYKRGTSSDEIIEQYCTNLDNFDESLQESWDYLKETGCSKRNNKVELITDEGQILVTTGLWNESRSLLRSINDIACSGIKPQLECQEISSDFIWSIVDCVRYSYLDMQPGLIKMLVAGPEKYFDKHMFCSSVSGLEACLYDVVTDACNTTMPARYDIKGDLFTHAKSVMEMAQCSGMP